MGSSKNYCNILIYFWKCKTISPYYFLTATTEVQVAKNVWAFGNYVFTIFFYFFLLYSSRSYFNVQ